ncbi:MAG TPA: ABC transporter permease [Azospirillaceae bacterium]|nr:ABC transporter permease [Azospirillaceae bacterium]
MGKGRGWTWALWIVAAAVFVFLMAPILAVIPLSFNDSTFLTYPMTGFSLKWYREFFTSDHWLNASWNSAVIGVASTVLATGLGTLAALGLNEARFPAKRLVVGLLVSPMIVPAVIAAVGLYFFFAPLGLTGSYHGIILSHTMLATPFVVITVSATLQGFDMTLVRAAASLGAAPAAVFFRVVLPLILPGVASGALLAFATSLDEVVMILFLAGAEQRTLPREMFSGIRENISPTILAVATMLTLLSVFLLATLEVLRRRNERLRGAG